MKTFILLILVLVTGCATSQIFGGPPAGTPCMNAMLENWQYLIDAGYKCGYVVYTPERQNPRNQTHAINYFWDGNGMFKFFDYGLGYTVFLNSTELEGALFSGDRQDELNACKYIGQRAFMKKFSNL